MSKEKKNILSAALLFKFIAGIIVISTICIFSFDGCPSNRPVVNCPIIGDTLYLYECQDSTLEICPNLDTKYTINANEYEWFNDSGVSVFGPSSDSCFQITSMDSLKTGYYYCEIRDTLKDICCRRDVLVQMYELDSLGGKIYPDEVIVLFNAGVNSTKKDSVREAYNATLLESCVCDSLELWRLPLAGDSIFIGIPPNQDTIFDIEDAIGSLRKRSSNEINEVEPNRPVKNNQNNRSAAKQTELVANQSKSLIKRNPLNDKEQIWVAIIDNGIDYNHLNLKNQIWENHMEIGNPGTDPDGNCIEDDAVGMDYANDDLNPLDTIDGHGTHIAGIIDSTFQIFGDTANVELRIINIRCLDEDGEGSLFNVLCGVFYAHNKKADIVNMSLGRYGIESAIMKAAIELGNNDCGRLFVTSAGNDSINVTINPHYPSGYVIDNIIEVAAVDPRASNEIQAISTYSNYGETVDVAVDGMWYSTTPKNNFNFKEGTSMSAGYVSGLLTSLLSYNTSASKLELRTHLLDELTIDMLPNTFSNNGKYIRPRQYLQSDKQTKFENANLPNHQCPK